MTSAAEFSVKELLSGIPTVDRAIVIFPADGLESSVRWVGMTAEQVASTLYQVADEVLRQRVPLRERH